jgi:GntR family transcriptional regulator / MocR family aminotransferase
MLVALDGRGTLVTQLARALRASILSGGLRPGERLPATRTLSEELGLSRNTVLAAYDQLLGEGYASSRHGSGTFVASEIPLLPRKGDGRPERTALAPRLSRFGRRISEMRPIWAARAPRELRWDFRYGRPAFGDFPQALWRRLLARTARRASSADLDYGLAEGEEELRQALAEHLARTRGVPCSPEEIVVTAGSQQALDLVARTLLDPGDRVLLEEPHYLGARRVFQAAGAKIVVGRVDAEGLDVSSAKKEARTARVAYVTPSHHFPTGVVMTLPRRLALLDWARRARAVVVEDDYDSEYRYAGRPIEALAGLDRAGTVVYVGTFSKVIFPALRLGYLVLPPTLVDSFRSAKALTDTGSSRLTQLALADFLRDGHFERHVRRTRRRNASRRHALLGALAECFGDRIETSGADAGLHLVLWLRELGADRLRELVLRSREAGVGIYPVTPFYVRPPRRAGLLLGWAGLEEREIKDGIAVLAKVVASIR